MCSYTQNYTLNLIETIKSSIYHCEHTKTQKYMFENILASNKIVQTSDIQKTELYAYLYGTINVLYISTTVIG